MPAAAPAAAPASPARVPTPAAARAGPDACTSYAPWATAALLLALYVATLAPGVTFWDAGEFIAAARTLGIPHPPGTPLFVHAARAWSDLLSLAGIGAAVACNLLSAACTAAAGALTTAMVARWTGRAATGIASGVGMGAMATLWLNATETEVYAAALLLALLALWCADRRGAGGDARWLAAAAYALALAGPLHLSALVVAPGVVALAARRADGGWCMDDALFLAGATLLALAVGQASAWAAAVGVIPMLVAATRSAEHRGALLRALPVVAIAATAWLILLVRARHDPAINQGNPSTLAALLEVVARRQYDVAPLWPRRAPVWLQAANVFQYADWQVALGLAPGVQPAVARTAATLAWLGLAALGSLAHRRVDARSWLAVLVLLVAGSAGVAVQLNLKAGASLGWGLLPDDAPHEARERDYFFFLAWWAWGVWAGIGAMALARARRLPAWTGVAIAAIPIALNWRGVTRRGIPEAALPERLGMALLEGAPRNAVLFVRGDNDSYPLWYLQAARGVRRDVTLVTLPLLAAPWYRAELARRHGLLEGAWVTRWHGEPALTRAIGVRAELAGRPVAAAISLTPEERAPLGRGWRLAGMVYVRDPALDGIVPDTAAAGRGARWAPERPLSPGERGGVSPRREPVARWAGALLGCPALTVADVRGGRVSVQLDSLCNRR